MARMIFVNLPVSDLDRSKAYFTAIGYVVKPQFTNEDAACLVISDTIYLMLLVRPFFATFTDREIVDARSATEVLVALSADSREDVDAVADAALAAGATEPRPAVDYGFMYQRSIADLDGHVWEYVWMDPAHVQ